MRNDEENKIDSVDYELLEFQRDRKFKFLEYTKVTYIMEVLFLDCSAQAINYSLEFYLTGGAKLLFALQKRWERAYLLA